MVRRNGQQTSLKKIAEMKMYFFFILEHKTHLIDPKQMFHVSEHQYHQHKTRSFIVTGLLAVTLI